MAQPTDAIKSCLRSLIDEGLKGEIDEAVYSSFNRLFEENIREFYETGNDINMQSSLRGVLEEVVNNNQEYGLIIKLEDKFIVNNKDYGKIHNFKNIELMDYDELFKQQQAQSKIFKNMHKNGDERCIFNIYRTILYTKDQEAPPQEILHNNKDALHCRHRIYYIHV